MNIAFMAGLSQNGPAAQKRVDSEIVSQGRECKRTNNKTDGFVQFFEKSKQGVKSDTVKNAGTGSERTKPNSVGKVTNDISKVSKSSAKGNDSSDLNKVHVELPEQFDSQLMQQLAELLRSLGITPGEVNGIQGDRPVQNLSEESGGQSGAMTAVPQNAAIMRLLQAAAKAAGETNGEGEAGLKAILQNLLEITDEQLAGGTTPTDARFLALIRETLKNYSTVSKQEVTAAAVTATTLENAGNSGGMVSGSPEVQQTVKSEKTQADSSVSVAAPAAVETGKQPMSVNSNESKPQAITEGAVKVKQSDSGQSNSAEKKDSGLTRRDSSGKAVNVPGRNEMVPSQPFELETQVNRTQGFDAQNPADMEQSSESAKLTRNIFGQIAQKAKLTLAPGVTEMQIQLKPEVLGKLNLTITSENGQVTAKFNAESHTVKAIIEANLGSLKDALTQQGVKVDQLLVDIGAQTHQQGFDRRNSYYGGSSSGNNRTVSVNSENVDKLFSRDAHSGAVNAYYGSTVEFTA